MSYTYLYFKVLETIKANSFILQIEGFQSLSIACFGKHYKKASVSATMKKFHLKIYSKNQIWLKTYPEKWKKWKIYDFQGMLLEPKLFFRGDF